MAKDSLDLIINATLVTFNVTPINEAIVENTMGGQRSIWTLTVTNRSLLPVYLYLLYHLQEKDIV